jgi:hypothetical protein
MTAKRYFLCWRKPAQVKVIDALADNKSGFAQIMLLGDRLHYRLRKRLFGLNDSRRIPTKGALGKGIDD